MTSAAHALGLEGAELLAHGGGGKVERVKAEEALAGKHVGVYFSAHWCGPCRGFTPVLAEVYERVRQRTDSGFQVLFVTADRNPQQFEEYFGSMPWLALPFEDQAAKQRLSQRFGVMGIPRLVIVGPDGQVVANDARAAVMGDRAGAHYPWAGAAGPSLLQQLLSPRGLLMLFMLLWWLSQYFSKKQ